MTISICIPCFNSQDTLPKVVSETINLFTDYPQHHCQIILVNDGSSDMTWEQIKSLADRFSEVEGINLMRNFGQDAARMAAFRAVHGDIAVVMDDDGQHPIEKLFELVQKIEEGYDIAYAHFIEKKHSAFRRSASWLNFWILSKTIGLPRSISVSSFFAVSKQMIQYLNAYNSPFPYTVGYSTQITSRLCNVDMAHLERQNGRSTYTLKRLLKFWLNGFTSFSIVPLRFASAVGFLTAFAGFAYGAIILVQKIFNPNLPIGYTSIMAAILFIGGMIMLMLGLLGEYVGRIFMTLSNKPQYAIREVCKHNE